MIAFTNKTKSAAPVFTKPFKNGTELIANGSFTGNANNWTLGDGWSYLNNSAVFISLGPELVANGSFTGNANGWTVGNAWSYGSNKVSTITSGLNLLQALAIVTGISYQVTFTTDGGNTEALVVRLGTNSNAIFYFIPAGTITTTVVLVAGIFDSNITFVNSGSLICSLDTVSVKRSYSGILSQNINTIMGQQYPVGVTATGSTGSVTVSLGGDTFNVPAGTRVTTLLVAGGSTVTLTPSNDFNGAITNVSVGVTLWANKSKN